MNTFIYFTSVFAIFLLDASVNGRLTCLQGRQSIRGGTEQTNTLAKLPCIRSRDVCHRYDVTGTTEDGQEIRIMQGTCTSATFGCLLRDCDFLTNTLKQLLPDSTFQSCCAACCDSDNCNDMPLECGGAGTTNNSSTTTQGSTQSPITTTTPASTMTSTRSPRGRPSTRSPFGVTTTTPQGGNAQSLASHLSITTVFSILSLFIVL